MAAITTRQTAGTGATVKNSPLTNVEVDTNFINLNTDLSNAVYLSTAQTISGVKTFTNGFTIGGSSYPNYRASIDFGADVGGTWRKIVTISSPVGTYVTIGFKIEVTDPQANHATTGSPDGIISHTYWVACVRTNDTVQDTPDACYVRGPGNLIRAVKTSTGNYEIQVQTLTQYREITVDISVYAFNGTHTVTYSAGTTASTGTVQYNATIGGYINWFGNLAATGKLGVGASPGTTSELRVTKSSTGNVNQYGILAELTAQSDVTSLLNGFTTSLNTQATAFTLTNLRHFSVGFQTVGAGSTITNQVGFFAPSILTGAVNNYGFYSDVPSGTGRWNFYANGTADNYFGGSLKLGQTYYSNTALGIWSSPAAASVSGIYQDSTINSATTTSCTLNSTFPNTAAASFTLTTLTHYQAAQNTLGAGSAITNQFGFRANSSLTGATNNYAFYSDVASGTGRWNFYANGTAPNYFAGSVSIGAGGGNETLFVKQTSAFYTATFENSSTDGVARGVSIRATANNVPTLNMSRWYNTFAGSADIAQIRFDGLGTTSTYVEHAAIYATATGANTATGAPTKLSFKTSDGTSSTERMAISATGVVTALASVASTTTTTGTVVVTGGVGVSGAIRAGGEISVEGGQFINVAGPGGGSRIRRDGSLNGLDLQTNSVSRLFISDSGPVTVTSTTASTTTTTGALVVAGGVGVAGAFNAAGNINTTGIITSTGTGYRTVISTDAGGSLSLGRIDNVASAPYIDFNSGATSTDFDVRLAATGGNGTSGNGTLTLSGNLSVTGNLTINGTTTTVNSTTVTIDDPIFTLGGDTAPTVDDNKDRGIEFRWHNGTAAKVGFFGYDDSTGYLTFIPDATNTSEVFSGTQGDIQATNFRGALVGNASTATTLQTARNINGVSFNGSADITVADSTKLPLSGGTLTGALTVPAVFTVNAQGAEGGEIVLKKGTGQTALSGDVVLDTLGSIFRIFENGGTFRQFTFDLTNGNISGVNGILANINGNAATVTNGVVTTGSYANPSWITSLSETKVLPSQTGHSGKFLTTNGTSTSWGTAASTGKAIAMAIVFGG